MELKKILGFGSRVYSAIKDQNLCFQELVVLTL